MRRAATAVLVGVVACGLAVVVIAAAVDRREVAFHSGAAPLRVAVEVAPGSEACQSGLVAEARFDDVKLNYGTYHRPGPRLSLRVADSATGRHLAAGTLAAGYPDNRPARTRLRPEVAGGRRIDVCVRNVGEQRVAIYGTSRSVAPSELRLDGRPRDADVRIVFRTSDPPTVVSQVSRMPARASVHRPEPIGAWTYWALLAGMALGLPALLAVGLRSAA